MIQSFYSGFINQPRSKLKLPIKELIKTIDKPEDTVMFKEFDNSLTISSKAEQLLEALRNGNFDTIPRLESINEITRELAIHGHWEKAESLILNMKTDCNVHLFYYFSLFMSFRRSGTFK